MAGRGSRLRPHTLTTAKPLIKVAGNSILLQLVKDAVKLADEPIEEMAFIVGDESFFGKEIDYRPKNKSVAYIGFLNFNLFSIKYGRISKISSTTLANSLSPKDNLEVPKVLINIPIGFATPIA